MLNKIDYYKGFGEYTEGVERWSNVSDSYLFAVRETGYQNEEGLKEKEYLRYEYSRIMPLSHVIDEFIRVYAEHKGYSSDRQAELFVRGSDMDKARLAYVLAEAEYYASGIGQTDRIVPYRKLKQAEIRVYDVSPEVNEFSLQGKPMWLPLDKRGSIERSTKIRQAKGQETTELWFDGICYTIPIPQALQMLADLEMYALDCYNATHKHLAAVDGLTTIEEIKTYNYKVGYPDKLNFNSKEIRTC